MEKILSREFGIDPKRVRNIVALIDEGNTIPFIARYRKELTGACDDQVLRELADRLAYLRNLEKRKQEVIAAAAQLEQLTEELAAAVRAASTLAEVEDLYRPYKQKRRTRATVARERGLEPLADLLFAQPAQIDIAQAAAPFWGAGKEVPDAQAALAGAMDIIAERLSDDAELRKKLRRLFQNSAAVRSAATKDEDSVYRLYYDYAEPLSRIPSHRVLALNRGEKEGFLKVTVQIDEAAALAVVAHASVQENSPAAVYVRRAGEDAWRRLIYPSLEREIRGELTESASEQAIRLFGQNLKPTLMQPPLHGKVVLGLDPAYRTGCKIAVIDPTGKVLDTTVVYPTPPHNKTAESKKTLRALIEKHGVEVIAIGNGTASKESELFVAELIGELPQKVSYAVVNEAGASVYSASQLAAREFPEFDVSLRSAVSIARRLQDPMAELVKIDPKAIGVGQYQHDMPVKRLDETLRGVVEDCVNSVGVDANTASPSLLSYVAGLSAAAAANLAAYRAENGAFTGRAQFKKVPKLGPRAFEQCAGFLRIPGGKHVLDNTAVHPESYGAAKKLLALFGYAEKDIGALSELPAKIQAYGEAKAAEACGVGVPTLRDIAAELQKPGHDIRDSLPPPMLRSDVMDINDLRPGMEFTGTVRNVIDFGAFVDIGVHQDGLVHISQMAERYLKHPSEAAKAGDIVTVRVLSVDVEKNRISLSMIPAKNGPK